MEEPPPETVRARLVAAYLEKRSELIRTFTARLRSATAAEDLVQEIYLRLDGLGENVEIHNEVGYLFRLGTNLMVDRLRSARRLAQREGEWQASHRVLLGGEEILDEPEPETRIDSRARLKQILETIDTLPPQTARVFRMHKFDGLSHSEIATRLGVSRSAVEKHMTIALARLLRRLP